MWEISVLVTQFSCEPKTIPKNEFYLRNQKKAHGAGLCVALGSQKALGASQGHESNEENLLRLDS